MLLMINHGIMRIFLSVLILLLSLQSWTKADDIRDFEIEGISIGDSLLDHFSEAEIKNGIRNMNIYSDDSFYDVEIYNLDLSAEFKNLSFSLKKNDKLYKIYNVTGFKFYEDNVKDCFNRVDEMAEYISQELKELENVERVDSEKPHSDDPTGNSKTKQVVFWLENGSIFTECYDWSEKITNDKGYGDNFSVGVSSNEYDLWLNNKAYN